MSVGGTFTQADIDNGLLTYTDNNATSNFSDNFSFTAADGHGGSVPTSNFAITITPVPTVTTDTGFVTPLGANTVLQGTMGGNVTSATMLITSDGSTPTANLTYTLTALPTDGTLYKITGNTGCPGRGRHVQAIRYQRQRALFCSSRTPTSQPVPTTVFRSR